MLFGLRAVNLFAKAVLSGNLAIWWDANQFAAASGHAEGARRAAG